MSSQTDDSNASSPQQPEQGSSAQQAYRVLARKYRPLDFSDLIGQEPMVRTLSNAFKTGRIAQAYMLTGVRGVGKTTTARILARALNYRRGDIDEPSIDLSEPGDHCQAIIEGRHVDVIEMDAASHTGIEDVRDIIESSQYRPVSARYKVYVIDEVHMLSKNAFNGLLKTLEEPPEHLKFIFATTEIRKVPITVLSRCQRFDLRRIEAATLMEHLGKIAGLEGIEVEEDALALLARAAEGSVRDSLSMLDQAIAHSAGKVDAETVRTMLGLADRARVIDLFEALMKGDVASALGELKSQYDIGAEPVAVLSDLADFVHYVTRLKYMPQADEDLSIAEAERKRGREFADTLSVRYLGRGWQMLLKAIEEVQASSRPLAAAEMALVRIAHAATLPPPDEIIRKLEAAGQSGAGNQVSTGAPAGGSGGGSPRQSSGQNSGQGASAVGAVGGVAMAGGSQGGNNALRLAAQNGQAVGSPSPQQGQQQQPLLVLNRYEELIYLAEDKRDVQLKTCLRRNVSLVHFENGRMDVHIVGNPPPNFLPELSRKLHEWTGQRWAIATSREAGAPTLEAVELEERRERSNSAKANPVVAAIMEKFPGSRIVDVRVRKELLQEPDDDSEEARGENLSEPMAAPEENDDDGLPVDENGLDDFYK